MARQIERMNVGAQLLLALIGGAVGVLGFAPFYFWPISIVSLGVLFAFWQLNDKPARACALGFAWGLGQFTVGVSWIYVSLHDYGDMPAILAAAATLLFCAYLALYPAIAGLLYRWLVIRFKVGHTAALMVLMPACFMAFEYLRGWIVSGFPWLSLGYSQTPGGVIAAPLAGYAAVIGMYGISWLIAMSVSAAIWFFGSAGKSAGSVSRSAVAGVTIAVWYTGLLLSNISWSEPSGKPIRVALLQGNVEQSLKWRDDQRVPTLENYRQMIRASDAALVVMPETALPDFLSRIPPEYLESLREYAVSRGADILAGVPIAERVDRTDGGNEPQYHLANSVVSIGATPSQRYDKQHLVAFGEFVPPMFSWVYRWLKIPLSDFNARDGVPRPMQLAGRQIAVNICYEDAFGREIAAQLPEAELLVNMSNMAWFGRSLAADQHAQMSQMRALETSRWMLRATNTGATAAINERGEIMKSLPPFTRATLSIDAEPRRGATPYVGWKDLPILSWLGFLLLAGIASNFVDRHLVRRSAQKRS